MSSLSKLIFERRFIYHIEGTTVFIMFGLATGDYSPIVEPSFGVWSQANFTFLRYTAGVSSPTSESGQRTPRHAVDALPTEFMGSYTAGGVGVSDSNITCRGPPRAYRSLVPMLVNIAQSPEGEDIGRLVAHNVPIILLNSSCHARRTSLC